jgi:excisionase family DNA binding protein
MREPVQPPPQRWTVKEVAAWYRVDETTVRRWIAKGAVQAERVGRTVRIVPPPNAQPR